MKTRLDLSRSFEFCFPRVDTLILVEEKAGQIVIRATRNTFSEPARIKFIHHLAREGFIPEEFQWTWNSSPPGLRWVIDHTWLAHHPRLAATSRRFMTWLLTGAAVTWIGLMTALFATRS
jgi:hypothetical protein